MYVLTALIWLVPHETAAVSAQVLCTPYNHAPCHFMQSHIRKVHACLAVTCHLHFWQNDRGLLRATTVTRGWNGYRKLTPEKEILPPPLQGFEPATFLSRFLCLHTHLSVPTRFPCECPYVPVFRLYTFPCLPVFRVHVRVYPFSVCLAVSTRFSCSYTSVSTRFPCAYPCLPVFRVHVRVYPFFVFILFRVYPFSVCMSVSTRLSCLYINVSTRFSCL